MPDFYPPLWLRGPHLQSILASSGWRQWLVARRAKAFLSLGSSHILNCSDGVRLQGNYTPHPEHKALVVLIHGWLGGNQSNYIISAAARLYANGYSVFRLNLRDHGDTTHLNRELFHSARLTEVIDAVAGIIDQFNHPHKYPRHFLIGFSLGGNFALRIAREAPGHNIALQKVIAVCPVIDPVNTNRQLNEGVLYHRYFLHKWRRAVEEKLHFFPDHDYGDSLHKLRSLDAMNDFFVPRYTGYAGVESYLDAYAVKGDYLASLRVDSHIIASKDDPVIDYRDFAALPDNPHLTIEATRYGGHCGFIKNASLESWIDDRLLQLLEQHTDNPSLAKAATTTTEPLSP